MATIQKRTADDGSVTHRVLIRLKGFPPQSATFKRLTDARNWAQKTETEMKENRFFKTAASKKHTVAQMIERYITRLQQHNPKRLRDVEPLLTWWKEELGYCILANLTKAIITKKIEELSQRKRELKDGSIKPISPARVNRYIAAFSHACTIAVNEWEWLEHHPFQKITKMKEPRGRVRFLDDKERQALLKACQQSKCPCLYTVVILALSTGSRFSEIMNLKWVDVDLDRQVIVLHETKNKERRRVPLAGSALALLREAFKVRRLGTNLVFPAPNNPKEPYKIRTAWNTAVKEAGLDNFRFHDLRHSAASYLAMNGASLAEIAEVLGHKTLQMVRRYAHLSEAHTAGVVARMNEKIFG